MTSDIFLGIAIGGIVIVAVLVFLVGRIGQRSRLEPLASLAFAFAPRGEGLISSGALRGT